MFIERDGKKIELTADELYTAYREQQHEYRLDDAEAQLADYFKIELYEDNRDQSGEWQEFTDTFGFSFDEATNKGSDHYILEDMVYRYEKAHDCNCDENSMWEAIIDMMIEERGESV